jgi:hypothetical protein
MNPVSMLINARLQMSHRTADEILDETFLDVRAKLLEVAATLDRIDRSSDDGSPLTGESIERRKKFDEAIRLLLSEGPDRAQRLQLLFSRQYASAWRQEMSI